MNNKQEHVRRLSTAREIEAIAAPLRLDLLQLFAARARTPKQAAESLGIPATRVYHHVGVLEREGLIEVVETRQKRGAREKYYAATATILRLDPGLVEGASQPGSACARATDILEAALGDAWAHLPKNVEPAEEWAGSMFLARATLSLGPAEVEGFATELRDLLARYADRDVDSGRPYRFTAVGVRLDQTGGRGAGRAGPS